MELQKEAQLVRMAQQDPEVFGALFDEYYPKILNYLVRRTGDVALAEDLCSQTFEKAFLKLWQFRFRGIAFSAWLYRIAGNELKMHFRGKIVHSLESLMEQGKEFASGEHFLDELVEAQEQVDRHQAFLRVQSALLLLPVKYQEVLALRFFEDKSIRELSEILGKREGTVKSLLSRGLEKLRYCNPFENPAL